MPSPPYGTSREDCSWFALRVRSQFDFRVEELLNARGIETFLPTWSEIVRWSDRDKIAVRPLFPGYVFAKFRARPGNVRRVGRDPDPRSNSNFTDFYQPHFYS